MYILLKINEKYIIYNKIDATINDLSKIIPELKIAKINENMNLIKPNGK